MYSKRYILFFVSKIMKQRSSCTGSEMCVFFFSSNFRVIRSENYRANFAGNGGRNSDRSFLLDLGQHLKA